MSDSGEFCATIEHVALKHWASAGFDRKAALFSERLDLRGDPIRDIPHRAMVQARQVFVFADAAKRQNLRDEGEFALIAMDNLLNRYCDGGDLSRGVIFSITPNGSIVSTKRDSYTHAFVLFALAAAFKLSQDSRFMRAAVSLHTFIETQLFDPIHSGLFVSAPRETDEKLQNPLMHMLEAYLFLHDAWPSGEYLERARSIVALFEQKLYREPEQVLPEFFARNWSAHPNQDLGGVFEPGHHFEWVWLLSRFDCVACTDHSDLINGLWETACRWGVSSRGLCYDAVDFTYSPVKKSTRLWPHAEGAKAAATRIRCDPTATSILERMLNALNSVFLGTSQFPGGWIDHFAPDGTPLVDYVPASSLYHLYLASSEIFRVTQESKAAEHSA